MLKLILFVNVVLLLIYDLDAFLVRNRIIGGKFDSINNVPYLTAVNYSNEIICGAVLISADKALSAAHCFQRQGVYMVRAGSTYNDRGGILVFVQHVIIHPLFNRLSNDYDIAILFLMKALILSASIHPVRLPSNDIPLSPGVMGRISGWGVMTANTIYQPKRLISTNVSVINYQSCNQDYTGFITRRMFCAGLMQGGKDACQGDSGGPFVVDGMLYGIISWGFDCAQPGFPGVYTSIPILRDFIKEYTNL